MKYTANFSIPDNKDAQWRLYWSLNEAIQAFHRANYAVEITLNDESGEQLINWAKK